MFWTSICPSSGVFYIYRLFTAACGVQHITANAQLFFTVLNTTYSSKQPIYIETPEDGHIDVRNMQRLLMRINHNCCIKLVHLVISRFRLSPKRTSPFKSAGQSVQSTAGSRGVRISDSNAGYAMFRGSVKSTGYPLHSPVSPSLPLPCVTVCHHFSVGL